MQLRRAVQTSLILFLVSLTASDFAPCARPQQQPLMSAADVLKLPVFPAGERIPYGKDPLQFGELRIPKGKGPHPVAVVIHGGCWISKFADLGLMAPLAGALAQAGVATWNIEYRRVDNPGGGWPGTFNDVAAAVDCLRALAKTRPLDLKHVVTVGHSAGGHLALWAAARSKVPKGSPLYSPDPLKVRGVVDLAGPGNLRSFLGRQEQVCGDRPITKLLGGSDTEVPERYRVGSPAELAPLGVRQVLITGAQDRAVPPEYAQEYLEADRAAGDSVESIIVDGAAHFEVIAPGSTAWPAVKRAVLTLAGFPGQSDAAEPALKAAFKLIAAERIRQHVMELAGPECKGRGAGYPGEEKATAYIAGQFKSIGLAPAGIESTAGYLQEFQFHPRRPSNPWEVLPTRNCVAFLRGSDPALLDEIVVLGAHHDGQGRYGEANMGRAGEASGADAYWPSANDNGSGVAGVLQIAEAMVKGKIPVRRSVLFITFTGEEHGLVGSLYYSGHPLYPWSRHAGMINLEMIGGEESQKMNARATRTSTAWAELLDRAAQVSGTSVAMTMPQITNDTDHYSFAARGVPAIHFGVGGSRADYHRQSDTADKVAYDAMVDRCRFAMATLVYLANMPERPAFTAKPEPDAGITGTPPTAQELEARRLSAEQGGIKVNAVVEGLPAQKAGLAAGDLIVAIDGRSLGRQDRGLNLLSQATRALTDGGNIRLKVLRERTELDLELKF